MEAIVTSVREVWHLRFDDVPDDFDVDSEVFVNENVTCESASSSPSAIDELIVTWACEASAGPVESDSVRMPDAVGNMLNQLADLERLSERRLTRCA
jgi:hypothetical protein